MRKIKFRGQDYQGKWHYGSFVIYNDGTFAIAENDSTWTDDGYHNNEFNLIKVKPETVGQFSGLMDKDGNGIYEGDVVDAYSLDSGLPIRTGVIKFVEGVFAFCYGNIKIPMNALYTYLLSVQKL